MITCNNQNPIAKQSEPPEANDRGKHYLTGEDNNEQEKAADFAVEILANDHCSHLPFEPTLEFQVAPLRQSIGLKSSQVTTQVCASLKGRELSEKDSRSPVDIVVALDVSGEQYLFSFTSVYVFCSRQIISWLVLLIGI